MRVAMFLTNGVPFGEEWAKAAAVHADVIRVAIVRRHSDRVDLCTGDDTLVVSMPKLRPTRVFEPALRVPLVRKVEEGLRRIESRRGPIDVLHGHFYSGGRFLIDLQRRIRIPFVLTEHSTRLTLESASHKPLSKPGLENARRAYQMAGRVIAVSEYLARCMRDLGLPGAIDVIGNPIDVELFRPLFEEPTTEEIRIVAVGRLEEDKDPLFLLRAFAIAYDRDPRLRLDFIGDGPDRSLVEAAVVSSALGHCVSVLGRLSRGEVADRVRRAQVFALGSRVETFCVAAAEAAAAGVPVVMPRIGPLPEVIDPLSGILIAPGNPVAFADGLLAASKRGTRFDKRHAADAIASRFSYEAVGTRLRDVYASIV